MVRLRIFARVALLNEPSSHHRYDRTSYAAVTVHPRNWWNGLPNAGAEYLGLTTHWAVFGWISTMPYIVHGDTHLVSTLVITYTQEAGDPMNDPGHSSPKILSDRVGAVIGAVVGSYFGPIGAGLGALAGHVLGGVFAGTSSEIAPGNRVWKGQQDVRSESATSFSDAQGPNDREVTICPHCGRRNTAGGLLCMFCGGRLPDAEEGDR